jgi:hypothetical protein
LRDSLEDRVVLHGTTAHGYSQHATRHAGTHSMQQGTRRKRCPSSNRRSRAAMQTLRRGMRRRHMPAVRGVVSTSIARSHIGTFAPLRHGLACLAQVGHIRVGLGLEQHLDALVPAEDSAEYREYPSRQLCHDCHATGPRWPRGGTKSLLMPTRCTCAADRHQACLCCAGSPARPGPLAALAHTQEEPPGPTTGDRARGAAEQSCGTSGMRSACLRRRRSCPASQ